MVGISSTIVLYYGFQAHLLDLLNIHVKVFHSRHSLWVFFLMFTWALRLTDVYIKFHGN